MINIKLWNVIRTGNGNDNFLFSRASFVVIDQNRNRIGQRFVFAQMLDFALIDLIRPLTIVVDGQCAVFAVGLTGGVAVGILVDHNLPRVAVGILAVDRLVVIIPDHLATDLTRTGVIFGHTASGVT